MAPGATSRGFRRWGAGRVDSADVFDLDAIRVRLDGSGWKPVLLRGDAGPPGRADAALWADPVTGRTTLVRRDGPGRTWDHPLDALAWMTAEGKPPTASGVRWIGYLGYDLGRWFESLPSPPPDDLGLPLFVFSLHGPGERQPPPRPSAVPAVAIATSTFSRADYLTAVARAVEYVHAGDAFQINLSQRFAVPCGEAPSDIYGRLPPAAYAACLDYGPFALVSHSPELLLRLRGNLLRTSPIKGTRPNGPGMAEALRDSEKDAAELHMIVDLERNDLGRVCQTGTVRVTQPRTIEDHGNVLHGAATVAGVPRRGLTFVDLLRATFPGGSITGAPKIRAMQIIDELEPVRRGPYCGGIGWVGSNRRLEFNVAIRTVTLKDGTAYVPVGGGIVADSDPAAEYDETLVKATAMFAALGVGW